MKSPLKIVAWELTRRCGLTCRHCRAAANDRDYVGELTTVECIRTIDAIVRVAPRNVTCGQVGRHRA